MRTIWLNGRLVEAGSARIDPADRGLLLGDGLFETMRAAAGRVPLLGRHLARLRAGAEFLEIAPPSSDAALAEACRALLDAARLADAALRLTLTRGPGPRGLLPPGDASPTLMLTAFPLPPAPGPARVVTAMVTRRNERSPLAGLKTLAYLDNLLALRESRAAGADEALLLNTADQLAGGSTANLFLVEGAGLVTPPLAAGALPGITRAVVMEVAPAAGLAVAEEAIDADRLRAATGAFLTSSLAGPRGIATIDGRPLAPPACLPALRAAWAGLDPPP